MSDPPPAGRRRALRLALRAAIALSVLLLGLELGFRWLLFSDGDLARRFGARLRDSSLFAQPWEDEFWRLRYALAGEPQSIGQADPVVGWRSNVIGPGNFAHRKRKFLNGRRPVLMYGDSFTACAVGEQDCWEGLLERSERADELCLMNYGVGGYGVDQMLLMLQRTIDRWSERDPVVVLGILIDDDLDRCTLTAREGPRPWFTLGADGALVEHAPVFPEDGAAEPPDPGVLSYLWRYLLHGADWVPWRVRLSLRGEHRHNAYTQALCGRLLEQFHAELAAREREHFVVLFHMDRRLHRNFPDDWREVWITAELERIGMPYVSSRLVLEADIDATGSARTDYFVPMGQKGQGHLNARGNEVVFRAILRGLAGDYDG